MNILFTQNLTLREFRMTDSHAYFLNNRDEQIRKYLPFRAHSDESGAKEDIACSIRHYCPKSFPYILAIVKTDTDKLIGHIGIGDWDISETDRENEIEYAISEKYRGFGYAAEAVGAFAPWCKSEFRLDTVYALVNRRNISSCKTLARAGFALSGRKFRGIKETTDVYTY